MTKILFIGNLSTSFVRHDYEILSKHFDVIVIEPPKTKLGWLKYPFVIARALHHNDLSFSWFAGWHSLFPVMISKIWRKKSVVVVGGYDAAYVPEINYGAFTNIKERIPAKFVLKHADSLLPVSEFTMNEVLSKVKPKSMRLIYNGIDIDKFKPNREKENIVITVGGVGKKNLKRKGIENFVRVASQFPDIPFVVIGKFKDNAIGYLGTFATPNVTFTGFVSNEELIRWYQKAKVICQLSYYEAFGLAPAEGMACGCIPVVTKERTGMPEFIGNAGLYAPYGDLQKIADAIKKALNVTDKSKRARKQIESFSLKRREKELLKVLK